MRERIRRGEVRVGGRPGRRWWGRVRIFLVFERGVGWVIGAEVGRRRVAFGVFGVQGVEGRWL